MGVGEGELGSGDSAQLSVNKRMDSKVWSASLKRTRAVTHMDLDDSMLSERHQTRKDKRRVIRLTGGVWRSQNQGQGVGGGARAAGRGRGLAV